MIFSFHKIAARFYKLKESGFSYFSHKISNLICIVKRRHFCIYAAFEYFKEETFA